MLRPRAKTADATPAPKIKFWEDDVRSEIADFDSFVKLVDGWAKSMDSGAIRKGIGRNRKLLATPFLVFPGLPSKSFGKWVYHGFGAREADRMADDSMKIADAAEELLERYDRGEKIGYIGPARSLAYRARAARNHIQALLDQAAPAHFDYQGFKVWNPDHLPEPLALRMLRGLDYLIGLFKRRGLEKVLLDNVKSFDLRFSRPGDPAGSYLARDKAIQVFSSVASTNYRKILAKWVNEVFLHEFGHHIHLNELHPRAKAEWDSAWVPVQEARKELEAQYTVTPQDRKRFWAMLEGAAFDAKNVGRKVKGIDRMKYLAWLHKTEGNPLTSVITQVRLNDYGKHVMRWFGDPAYRAEYMERYQYGDPATADERRRQQEERLTNRYRMNLGLGDYYADVAYPTLSQEMVEQIKAEDKTVAEALDKLEAPTPYAQTNETEDFAESFVSFMDNPSMLSDQARYRMQRALSLSGLYGKPVMRLGRSPAQSAAVSLLRDAPDEDVEELIDDVLSLDKVFDPESRRMVPSREVADELRKLKPEPYKVSGGVQVYHATDAKTARSFLRRGFIPSTKPMPLAQGYAPGRGLDPGLYVGHSERAVEGYGPVVLEITVPRSDIEVPTEQAQLGVRNPMEALRGHDGAVIFKPIPPEAFTVVRGRTGSARMASNVKVDTSKYRREVTEDAEDLARRSFDRQEENRGHEYDTDDLADRAEALLGDTKDVRQFRRMPDAIKSVYDLEGVLTTKIRELTDVGDYDAGDDVMALIRELMDYEDTLEERRTLDEWLEQTREWTREPMEGTERIAANLAKAMADAIGRIDPWNGSKVLITAQVPRDFQFGDVEHRPATAYYVKVGGDDAGFSVFTDKAGKIEHIDDVLEAGDTDFFRDPRDQMDYFNLVRELRHPGSTQRAGKDIVLWTARPVKDRRLYERARTVPPNIFLTTDPDRAYGIARDLGGGAQRDLWRMVINERHLMKTLDAGRTKDYQTIGDKPVPVKRVELVSEGQGKVARLARVAARYLEGHR